ncbi:hypothetical protein [Nonomuraea longicatena]|uniref:Uncharacterized protein n=1 Tax=Nonomuraea longicatena TaxID=83682 RepID=A0ABP3ZZD2_9ACTN
MSLPQGDNHGVVITGGTFTGSSIGGQGAVFHQGTASSLRALVEDLLDRVDEHEESLPEARHARRDLRELLSEAQTPPGGRDRERITAALDRLALRLAPVTALASALAPIAELAALL